MSGRPGAAEDCRGAEDGAAEAEAMLVLAGLPGLGDRGVHRALQASGTASKALASSPSTFRAMAGPAATDGRSEPGRWAHARSTLAAARNGGLIALPRTAAAYPGSFLELHDPPPMVFAAGDLGLLQMPAVSIVGSRKATEAGRRTAERLAASLGRAGVATVSGMAFGIDAAAHRGALMVGGRTIAVLGSGADRPTPSAHTRLYREIRTQGLVLSEFPPGAPAHAYAFPRRNRLIAALGRAVVVVEAARRSGALITVDHALDLGRDVFAVPGTVEGALSAGTNALIRDGARILLDAEQLLVELGLDDSGRSANGPAGPGPEALGQEALRLWNALGPAPNPLDSLARSVGCDAGTALAALTELELDGWVVRHEGMRFAQAPDRCASVAG